MTTKQDEGITLDTVDHMGRVHPAPLYAHQRAMLDAVEPAAVVDATRADAPEMVSIARGGRNVLEAAQFGLRVFVHSPQRGWIEGGVAVRAAIKSIAAVNGPLHVYGAVDVTGTSPLVPVAAPGPAPVERLAPVATEYHGMLDTIAPVLPHYAELVTILRGVFGGVAPMGDFDREAERVADDMARVEKYHDSARDSVLAAWALGVLLNLCHVARSTQNARNCLRSMAKQPAG